MVRSAKFVFIGALLALPALADSNNTKSTKTTAKTAVPDGYVLIEDFVSVDLKQLPIDLLRTADNDFSQKNLGETAADLRAAGRVFHLESKQSKGDNGHLSDAVADLDKLASDVRNGIIKTDDAFRIEVSKALYHDAAHHRMQAQKEWDMKNYSNAGDDMRASAISAELASSWSANKDLVASTKPALDKARQVASELTRNEGWTPGEVNSALASLEGAVDRIAGTVMPSSDKARAGESSPTM
jgi:hypothetical protein